MEFVGEHPGDVVRRNVADQLAVLVSESTMTGGPELFAKRMRAVAQAKLEGDDRVLRAAVMEMAVAASLWAVDLDLR
jgi:hypothetical protein